MVFAIIFIVWQKQFIDNREMKIKIVVLFINILMKKKIEWFPDFEFYLINSFKSWKIHVNSFYSFLILSNYCNNLKIQFCDNHCIIKSVVVLFWKLSCLHTIIIYPLCRLSFFFVLRINNNLQIHNFGANKKVIAVKMAKKFKY